MAIIQGNSSVESAVGAYEIPNSLRFNSADSAYLSWTPSVSGNRRTWTLSFWHKRSKITDSALTPILGTPSNTDLISFDTDDVFRVWFGTNTYNIETTQVFRDVSAWGHWVVAVDTTQGTPSNRVKIYYNGSEITAFSTASYPTLDYDTGVNNTVEHRIGRMPSNDYNYLNGYLTEVQFIDGSAKTPSDFGEFNTDTGVWQPKAYTGSYGTNGFYLPMTQDQIVEGFNTVLYRGNASTNKVTGVGFAPDLVWIKDRTFGSGSDHFLFDSLRTTYSLSSNTTGNETQKSSDGFTSLDADGFTLNGSGGGDNVNRSGSGMVAWCWDAGNSTVTNNDGDIASQVRANPTYGFSIVTWTGNITQSTIGHGLGTAPKFIIVKNRTDSDTNWQCWHTGLSSDRSIILNATDPQSTDGPYFFGNNTNIVVPTDTVFTVGGNNQVNGSSDNMLCYCFSEVSGYSKFGSYSGNGSSTGPTVTTGFRPAFLLIKSSTRTGTEWHIIDDTRDTVDPLTKALRANRPDPEFETTALNAACNVQITDTGFTVNGNVDHFNFSGETYIYAAFADKREAAFWRDFSGNGNNWQPNNLDFNDSMVDTPTPYGTDTGVGAEVRGNYATWNPLAKSDNHTLSNGNLTITSSSYGAACATFGAQSGKWYWEFAYTNRTATNSPVVGFGNENFNYRNPPSGYLGSDLNGGGINTISGTAQINATSTSYGSAISSGDLLMFAMDLDNRKFYIGKNGTWFNSGDPVAGTGQWPYSGTITGTTFFPAVNMFQDTGTANFGQLPFAYAAPTGYKSLCTTNLPDPAIADGSTNFDVALYTGNGVNTNDGNTITGLNFKPDFVWLKCRSSAETHSLQDVLRGPRATMYSQSTENENANRGYINSFTSDGFTTGNANGASINPNNANGFTYATWNWKAGGTGVSNTAGSITSTVSANPTAGFSVLTYTGNGTAGATVGHGLSVAPSFLVVKNRDTAGEQWVVYHKTLGGTQYLKLSDTSAVGASVIVWNNTDPTSSVITLGNWSAVNQSTKSHVCYAFSPVEGYSAFGSYTGNGSADGPFVYTNHRPRFLLVKCSSVAGEDWIIVDAVRNEYNYVNKFLFPNLSNAEGAAASNNVVDFLSNGFKVRSTSGAWNSSSATYVYASFCENPFKYSLAR